MQGKKTFEEKMKRLEEIVDAMQSAQIPLDESISLFEEGSSLIAELSSELKASEEKVKILVKNSDGEYTPEDFKDE